MPPATVDKNALELLFTADPQTAQRIYLSLKTAGQRISPGRLRLAASAIVPVLALDTALGERMAAAMVDLITDTPLPALSRFVKTILNAARTGPALVQVYLAHLPAVLKNGDPALESAFMACIERLSHHGTYTLQSPLAPLPSLLQKNAVAEARCYLCLLHAVFRPDLPYERAKVLVHQIPRAVLRMPPARRSWQLAAFYRAMTNDQRLLEPFLKGLEQGLSQLGPDGLETFMNQALEQAASGFTAGKRYLSLEAHIARKAFEDLRTRAPLMALQPALNAYLRARLGQGTGLRDLSEIPAPALTDPYSRTRPLICCNGKDLFLPETIDWAKTYTANMALARKSIKWEAGLIEFGTFAFDLDRLRTAVQNTSLFARSLPPLPSGTANRSDLACFWQSFPDPALAAGLFTIFEHGRQRHLIQRHYPGLYRRVLPFFQKIWLQTPVSHFLAPLYAVLALGLEPEKDLALVDTVRPVVRHFLESDSRVETCGVLTLYFYDRLAACMPLPQPLLPIPFNRRIRPDLFFEAHRADETHAHQIRKKLAARGIRVQRADLREALAASDHRLDHETLRELIRNAGSEAQNARSDKIDIADLLGRETAVEVLCEKPFSGKAHWYPEWDNGLQDYLHRHSRVIDQTVHSHANLFYPQVLHRHQGLVSRIRYAFELMKPEGLKIRRPWVEGDDLDYRALIDMVVARRLGQPPSSRLYIQRIKALRDVAVLLLVDLSRSTTNTADGTDLSVLEIEKQAIVLFCEALDLLGDPFALAGFSSNGRLAVEYLRIKDFDEPMNTAVRHRIGNLSARRSTRMGAAIRHATARLAKQPARVRLLMIMGDGFPNDTCYKKDYALADTRRAVGEARAKGIHSHAITVNMAADPRLEALYGPTHQSLVSDVRDLPEQLHRIYSRLTA